MQTRHLAAALALGLGVTVVVAAPSCAGVLYTYDFAERAAGMPTTSEPARTLTGALVERYEQFDDLGDRVRLRAELGAEPTAATDASLHVAMGRLVDGACTASWEDTVSTLEPGEGAEREGVVVTVTRPDTDPAADGWDCGWVELLDPSTGATLDRREGVPGTAVIVDPAPGITVRLQDDAIVRTQTWDAIRLRLHTRADASRVVLTGHGQDVRVRPVVLEAAELRPRRDLAWLPVRLRVDRPRGIIVVASAFDDQGELIGRFRLHVRLTPQG